MRCRWTVRVASLTEPALIDRILESLDVRAPSSASVHEGAPDDNGSDFKLECHQTHSSPALQHKPRVTLPIGLSATVEGGVVEPLPRWHVGS